MPNYRVAGIDVAFPFSAYDCQLVYMERVIQALQQGKNALLESPTGTGKTLCLLCATLAWRESLEPSLPKGTEGSNLSQEIHKRRLPIILYSSRTHSQLQQVIRELKSTAYRPKMVVLGSREQMCIHSDVKQLRGRGQNQACRALCKSRACHHQNRVAGYLQSHPEMGEEPFDIEDLVNIGRTQGPCPYYLSRELHNSAEILFAPYNYLIEKENRKSLTGINWENTVLIFDEAHNLESICADAASFDLPASLLSACIMEAKQCVDLASVYRTSNNSADSSVDPENFAILKALLLELDKRISEVPLSSDMGFTKPGPHIFDFLADIKINHDTITMLLDTIDNATNLLEDDANAGSVKLHKRPGSSSRLQLLRDALRIVFRGNDQSHARCYRFHIHEPYGVDGDKGSRKGSKGRTLSWWCFNPGLAMEEFSQLGVRSVILTSGTLSPLNSFALELKLPFLVRLENPHVIGSDQVWVGVVCSGPSGRPLNSSYRTRDSLEYKIDLGNTIVNFARIVPDGLLVFFPSYYLLNQCMEAWQMPNAAAPQSNTVWERICKHKQPVIEPKDSALFNHANEDFIAKLNDVTSSGAVFFAVCRGKVSEGLDFADKAGRAVIITGIPFAMKTDPKVKLKREYLDEQARLESDKKRVLTGEEWYVQQASRAVNQAVGRVIRHKDDYGAIILCDERFAQGSAQNQMSLWLRPHVKCYTRFGDATFALTRFFRDKAWDSSVAMKLNEQSNGSIQSSSACSVLGKAAAVHYEKSLRNVYMSIQEHGMVAATDMDKSATKCAILGQRLTEPSGLQCDSVSAATSLGQQKSLSAILTNAREKSAGKKLPVNEIVPANRSTGSAFGSVGLIKNRSMPSIGVLDSHEATDSDAIDLASPSPSPSRKQGVVRQFTDDKLVEWPPGRRRSESQQSLCSEASSCRNGERNEQKDRVLKAESSCKQSKPSSDHKSKNAADFLKEVKARLSAPEYKRFVECIKGLKQQVINIKTVLDAVANLFSAPERIFLLQRFGEFVPAQHRELYETFLSAKRAAIEQFAGRCFDGDEVPATATELDKPTGLIGLPRRSRKRPADSTS
ncbi:hypothetical protein GOP47_0013132 [Adiantum capillus-veneris]|uniref:Regulator of telomere elongation helicase 1 homolog n=1 Tax=Adiantum capillus-veneris TaxID=13818 RepID=A0A9D4UMY3_ADICA|nr:hypothetical protein GOP47_0013132 [Adiantum capillus-veneris]